MRWRSIHRAPLLAAAAGFVLCACFIDEREYDPALADPRAATSTGLGTPVETCAQYCATVQANCTGIYQVYLNTDDCMRICSLLPSGAELADPIGTNTVACRQRNAELATSEKDAYCPAAGPGGSGRCGANCEAYCLLREALCSTVLGQDTDPARCAEQCPAVLDVEAYRPDPRATGDTLQCRINHLVNASQSEADALRHCWHTSVAPDVQMVTPSPCADAPELPGECNGYCDLVMFSCTEQNQAYHSVEQCRAVCRAFPLGTAGDLGDAPGENTVGCRRYHAYAALNDPRYHCPHAGPMGDGHCGERNGNNCESYCRILKRACTARFEAEHLAPGTITGALLDNPDADDLGDCPQDCLDSVGNGGGAAADSRYSLMSAPTVSAEDDDDPDGDRGDLLQCRTYHAILALAGTSGTDPDPSQCDAAFGATPCQ